MNIIILTGQTCSGKSTLERDLRQEFGYIPLRSMTTRKPRTGEVAGVHYDFVTVEEFKSRPLIESVCFNDNYYGMPADQLTDPNGTYIAVVEPHGRTQIMNYCDEHKIKAIPVFLYLSPELFADRFMDRYEQELLDNPDYIEVISDMRNRLKVAVKESSWLPVDNRYVFSYTEETKYRVQERIRQAVEA